MKLSSPNVAPGHPSGQPPSPGPLAAPLGVFWGIPAVEAREWGHVCVCVGAGRFGSGEGMSRLLVDTVPQRGLIGYKNDMQISVCLSACLASISAGSRLGQEIKECYLPSPPPTQQQNTQIVLRAKERGSELVVGAGKGLEAVSPVVEIGTRTRS